MAFSDLATVNAAIPGSQRLDFNKAFTVAANGRWYSLWTVAGLPGQGVAPSSGVAGDIPTSATTGTWAFVNPASNGSYVARIEAWHCIASSAGPTQLAIYDRLWQNSGLSVTITTAQTVQASTPAVPLTRPDANGAQVEAWFEVYGLMGAGTPTVTLTYTDQDGNTGNTTTLAMATTMALGRTDRFPLAAGDTGVRSIQTWQANATFTSGTIGLVQRRLVLAHELEALNRPTFLDAIDTGLPRVYDNACLECLFMPASSNAPAVPLSILLANG